MREVSVSPSPCLDDDCDELSRNDARASSGRGSGPNRRLFACLAQLWRQSPRHHPRGARSALGRVDVAVRAPTRRAGPSPSGARPTRTGWRAARSPRPGCSAFLAGAGDRKSTRLNSSHGYISYAVFCLKKKKKKNLILPFTNKKKTSKTE